MLVCPREVDDRKAKVFARDKQYKLYRSGEFYDVSQDFEEKAPLSLTALTEKQRNIYRTLKSVIDRYDAARKTP